MNSPDPEGDAPYATALSGKARRNIREHLPFDVAVAPPIEGSSKSTPGHQSAMVNQSGRQHQFNPGGALPDLVWLQADGTPGRQDVGIVPPGHLVVSERVLEILRQDGLDYATYSPWTPDAT